MGIEHCRVDLVKDFVTLLLLLAKDAKVLKDLSTHPVVVVVQSRTEINRLFVQHRVLSEELKLNLLVVTTLIVRVKVQVFHTE